MMQEMKKEIRFGLRSNRFLILLAGFLFYSFLTPVMIKIILPQILKQQFTGITDQVMSEMFDMSQLACLQSYMGDVFELGAIIVVFSLCGILAQEIKDNTLVLPLCSGKQFARIVSSKVIVFGGWLFLVLLISLLVDYLYAGLLFSFEIGLLPVFRAGVLEGFYMVFLVSCLVMWGAVTKKPIATGFATLGTIYGFSILGSVFKIDSYLPSGLLTEALTLSVIPPISLVQTIFITAAMILIFTAITLLRLQTMEWNERCF